MKTIKQRFFIATSIAVLMAISWASAIYNNPTILSNHPFLKKLTEDLALYQKTYGEDKVYLQFDKQMYEPKETIWYTAYVRDAQTLKASTRSEVVYVELINPKGAVEQQVNLIAQGGKAAGMFVLPETLKGGLYTIKAYTQWQKNTSMSFERTITVQKTVLPNLKMKLDFNRKAYGKGADVTATLDLNTLTKQPLINQEFKYSISLDGKVVSNFKGQTNEQGRSILEFKLPKNLKTTDGLLNVMIPYKGQTESIARSIPIVLGMVDLAFYPEGGDWIAGRTCGMGFKALNEFGKPVDVKGDILDDNNRVVASFNSYHQGMGKVEFIPKAGVTYRARIHHPKSIEKLYELPKVIKDGLSLRVVEQTKHATNLEITSSSQEEIYVVAQARQQIYFSKNLQVQEGTNLLSIPTEAFPIGIAQITIFDEQKIARAERLVFVNADQQLNIKITTDKEKYLPREKVDMDLEITDERGMPMSGSFSLVVTDDNLISFADDKQGHILSYILLESDLKGEIVEPNFYFDNEQDPSRFKPEIDRKKALDCLLMTQGWRRFSWEKVRAKQHSVPKYMAELAGIKGAVVDAKGTPIVDASIELLGKDKKVSTNDEGQFDIKDWKLYEGVQVQAVANGYYPVVINLQEYNNQLMFRLFKEKKLTGVVKGKNKGPIANVMVSAVGIPAVQADDKGRFSLTMPDHLTQITVAAPGYQQKVVSLTDNVNHRTIVLKPEPILDEVLVTSLKSRRLASRVASAPPVPPAPAEIVEVEEEMEIMEPVEAIEEEIVVEDIEENLVAVNKEALALPVEDVLFEKDVDIPMDQKKLLQQDFKANRPIAVGGTTRYHRVRQFPVVTYDQETPPLRRTDFRSTIYWNPQVKVDKKGKAKLTFYNSDAITQFRVTVEGFSTEGGIGRKEQTYFTQLPVEIQTKVPRELLTGDQVNIPVTLSNNTSKDIQGNLQLVFPDQLKLLKKVPTVVPLKANASQTILIACQVQNEIALGDLELTFETNGLKDELVTPIVVRARGFPVREVFSGNQMHQDFDFHLQEALEGSVVTKLQVYPSVLDEVMSGMESMLRMPSGCFEQTSSTNYPNLLVLNYLRETETALPQVEKQAKTYLAAGYKRLVGYESKSGGFDWWGRDPAHEALSAYGLMEFVDMKAVYPVDQQLIERTAKWLLKRKNGKGGWKKNPHALHSWARAEVTDAYIVWAMTSAGYGHAIQKEINKSYKDAVKSEDPYMMALVANALLNVKDKRAVNLVEELSKLQQKDGSFMGLTSSVTNSTGQSLKIETSSLAALAMMRIKGYSKAVQQTIQAIQQGKSYYGYGSTQGTVLALKALLEYAKNSKSAKENGTIEVLVNHKKVIELPYTANQKEIVTTELAKFLKDGKQKVRVQYVKTKKAMPFDIELSYTTRLPQNSPLCKLDLETKLGNKRVGMGEIVRLTTVLSNLKKEGLPMTMAMIGIPAGLSVQAWQLKELQEKKIIDYYELFDGYVVVHYEQLNPKESKTVSLDLKADIPGVYEAPASSAFLYYTNEHKVWAMPEQVSIN